MDTEKTPHDILSSALLIQVLGYSFLTMGSARLTDEQLSELIKKWQDEGATTLIAVLDKAGFAIVKKEPALTNYPPIN